MTMMTVTSIVNMVMDAVKVVNVEFGREFAITQSVLFLHSVRADMCLHAKHKALT